jgi:hypothetical protein
MQDNKGHKCNLSVSVSYSSAARYVFQSASTCPTPRRFHQETPHSTWARLPRLNMRKDFQRQDILFGYSFPTLTSPVCLGQFIDCTPMIEMGVCYSNGVYRYNRVAFFDVVVFDLH